MSTPRRSPAWPSRVVNIGISLVLPSTATWAITTLVRWSRQAIRCGAVPSRGRAPRTVLPSTASTIRRPGRRRAASCDLTHAPTAASKAAGSTAVSTRQMVARSGTAPGRPSRARSRGGASAAHSAIAAYDRAPASIAHTTMARTGARAYRIPLGSRGSGTCARASSRPSGAAAATARSPRPSGASWPAASTVGEDDMAGTAPSEDHEVWKPHDHREAVPAPTSLRSRRVRQIWLLRAPLPNYAKTLAHDGWHLDALVLVTAQRATHYEPVSYRAGSVPGFAARSQGAYGDDHW